MKKLKTWQKVLLVIFYPVGIVYLIFWIKNKNKQKQINYNNNYDLNNHWFIDRYKQNPELHRLLQVHYDNLEKIGVMYSILNNSRIYFGEKMDQLIYLCEKDIALAEKIKEEFTKERIMNNENTNLFDYVTFKRLAIIYEKRKEYDKAIDVCVYAIKLGYYNDGTEGKMYGRLAKLLRLNGINIMVDDYLNNELLIENM